MTEQPTAACYHRLTLAFVLLWTLAPAGLQAQSDPPVVQVSFEIVADLYRQELGMHIDDLQRRLADDVVDRLGRFDALDYVTWETQAAASTDTPGAQLRIVLEGKQQGLGTVIRLHYFSEIKDAEENDLSDEDLDQFNPVVFQSLDQKYAQSPDKLFEAIADWLDLRMTQAFSEALVQHFLRFVPLATDVRLDNVMNRLIVPIRYAAFHPSSDSRLRAVFTSQVSGQIFDGDMNLRPAGKRSVPEFNDQVLNCMVAYFNYPEVFTDNISAVESRWEDILSVLHESRLIRFYLFMDEYVKDPFPGTDDHGLILADEPI